MQITNMCSKDSLNVSFQVRVYANFLLSKECCQLFLSLFRFLTLQLHFFFFCCFGYIVAMQRIAVVFSVLSLPMYKNKYDDSSKSILW